MHNPSVFGPSVFGPSVFGPSVFGRHTAQKRAMTGVGIDSGQSGFLLSHPWGAPHRNSIYRYFWYFRKRAVARGVAHSRRSRRLRDDLPIGFMPSSSHGNALRLT